MLLGIDGEVIRRWDLLVKDARHEGIRVMVTSGFRSFQEQQRLFDAWVARGRRGLPAAAPGFSTHEYGYAIDAIVTPEKALPFFGILAECYGLKWAGARDRVHFDPFGFSAWRQMIGGQEPSISYRC